MIVDPDEWPYGLQCIDCKRPLTEGMPYSERLEAVCADSTIVVEIVCVPCGMRLT